MKCIQCSAPRLPVLILVGFFFFFVPALTAQPLRVNLAKYQSAQGSSAAVGDPAVYATDGIVGNGNRWKSDGVGPHTLTVTLPLAMELGSAHLYLGRDDIEPVANFALQYWTGSTWAGIPGASVSANTNNVLSVIFAAPIKTARVRFYSTAPEVRLRELALFAPNGPAGHPIGTDVTLNLARKRFALGSTVDGTSFGKGAVDGYVENDLGRWKSGSGAGPHTLEVDLQESSRLGSAHLYLGSEGNPTVANFTLQYWNGSAWATIPGGAITGNTNRELRVSFTSPVSASRVRLHIPDNGAARVRELLIFAAQTGATNGYPLGTDVLFAAPPTTKFDTYGDGFWKIVNRAFPNSLIVGADGASQTQPESTEEEKHFQLLYDIGCDAFKLRNRDSWLCIGAQDAAKTNGSPVIEISDYQGMPHELWRFTPAGTGGDFRIVNVWSGLVLQTDGASPAKVTLAPAASGNTRQYWRFDYQTHYTKKGAGGYEGDWAKFGTSWHYNWGRDTGASLPPQVSFVPMQHNRWWPDWNTLPQYYSGWHTTSRPQYILGYNEPEQASQGNISMADAIALWPLLESSEVPLVSPVPVNPFNGWLADFYNQAGARGYRIDFTAVHWYGNPDASGLINMLQSVYNTWGRPVWLTEFSPVDWNGTATWTEEHNYRFLSEFLWRAEDLAWLKRYAVFCFNNTPPANPWDRVGPTGSMFSGDGSTFTPYGQLYSAWDGDRALRDRTAYFIQGLASMHRLRASSITNAPSTGDIRRSDASAQWALVPASVASRWYIVSLRDGRRLRFDGALLDLAPPGTTGGAVQWAFNGPDASGYVFIDHHATSKSLRLNRGNDGNGAPTSLSYGMENFGTVADNTRWRFIKPHQPAEVAAPLPVDGVSALPGTNRISLSWLAGTTADFLGYSVYRSITPNGPFARIASGLTAPGYVDAAVISGVRYYYVVTVSDWIENESSFTPVATATPILPSLDIRLTLDGVTISTSRSGVLDLYSATNLVPPVHWARESAAAYSNGQWLLPPSVTTNGNRFFRLQAP